jgi:DNA-binding Xre family transcriptional regulator
MMKIALFYKPIWHPLIERDMRKIKFRDMVGISNTTLAKLGKNEPVSLEIIDKICTKLEFSIQDVVEITN